MINRHKWRYGYGRQCYMDKFAALTVDVPWKNGAIDQDTITELVTVQRYFPYVRELTQ